MTKERMDTQERNPITGIAKAQRKSARKTLGKILIAGSLLATTVGGIAITKNALELDIKFGFNRAIGETSGSMAQDLYSAWKEYNPNDSKTSHQPYQKQETTYNNK